MNLAQHIADGFMPFCVNLRESLQAKPLYSHLYPENTAKQTVRRVVEKIGIDEETPSHSLRQAQVLALVEKRGRVSHADIAITLDVSIHTARSVVRVMLFREQLVRDRGSSPSTFSLPVAQ